MRVLQLMSSGNVGGVEVLVTNYMINTKHDNYILFGWNGGIYAEKIKQLGINVFEFDTNKQGAIALLKKIFSICDEYQIEVIVTQHPAPLFKIAVILLKLLKKDLRIVEYCHCDAKRLFEHKKFEFLRKQLQSFSYNLADCVVAISDSVRKSLITDLAVKENLIRVIYNGVDLSKFEFSDIRYCNEYNIVYVGRLIEGKGIEIIIEALSLLDESYKFHFNVIGDGPLLKKLEKQAKDLGLCEQITFLGSRNDVNEILKRQDIFIHVPTLAEGFGITIVEALASGLICICSNSGAIPEIIDNGKDGYLIEANSTEQLASKICNVFKMTEVEKKEMRYAALNKAKKFSIEEYSERMDECIENI